MTPLRNVVSQAEPGTVHKTHYIYMYIRMYTPNEELLVTKRTGSYGIPVASDTDGEGEIEREKESEREREWLL